MRLLRALLPIVVILPTHPLVAQRESLAHDVGVRADSIVPGTEDRAAASTVTELIRGRAAGLNVRESGGTVGAAPRLWIRGPSSVMLGNDPLVVVDGIRIVSDPDALTIGVGGAGTSRLEDIDPNDVQRVRVLRGPAATAVYGPEGANGVIEITTRGTGPGGGPRFHAWSGLGARSDVAEYPANFARPGSSGICSLQLQARAGCTPSGPIQSFNPLEEASPFRTGRSAVAGVALRGTARGGGVGYALSGGVEDAEGVLDRNHRELRSLRGSVDFRPADGLRLALTAAHVRRETALPFGDQSQFGRIGAGLGGFAVDDPDSRGYRGIPVRDTFYHNTESVRHTTLGASAEWRTPLRWLSLGLHASRDQAYADELSSVTRVIAGNTVTTRRAVDLERARSTAGGRLTAAWSRWGALRGDATVGAERLGWTIRRVEDDGSATVDSLRSEQPDVGVYLRSGLQWREAVALSVALRRDEPSRTGQPQWSYSAGGQWALDREPWFPARTGISGLRLRAAYGETERGVEALVGLPPGPCMDACPPQPRTETLAEREAGVDFEMFRGAVSIGVTAYRRETRHLVGLLPVVLEEPQYLAMGRLHNRGVEVQAGLRGGRGDFVRWEIQATGASNRNRVEADEDGLIPFSPAFGTVNRDGRPLGSYFFRQLLRGEDRDGDGIIEVCTGTSVCEVQLSTDDEYLGSSLPDLLGSLAGTLRLGGAASLYARADYQGGARLLDLTSNQRCTTRLNCRADFDPATPADEQARVVAAMQGSRAGFVHDADFVRLREVAVTVSAPRRWARRFGAAGVDLTVGGRNLAIWTDYPGLDPEVNAAGPEVTAAYDLNPQPPVRMWTTRVNVRF